MVKCLLGNECSHPNCLHKEWHHLIGEYCKDTQLCKKGKMSRCVDAASFLEELKEIKEELRIESKGW